MKKVKYNLLGMAFLAVFSLCAQDTAQHYERALDNVSMGWKKLSLPDDLFEKTRDDMNDVRVYGINAVDSTEVPYLIQKHIKTSTEKHFAAKLYNKAQKGDLQYQSIAFKEGLAIDEMKLKIKQKNFDVWYDVEGSIDGKDWFLIAEKLRVLGIAKGDMDYSYTSLKLPNSSYAYYRLSCKALAAPDIESVYIRRFSETSGDYKTHLVEDFRVSNNKTEKKTVVDIRLKNKLPVSHFHLEVLDTLPYYRMATLSYLKDSVQVQSGKWRYNYRKLDRGVLNSSIAHQFEFSEAKASVFRVEIENQDNAALQFSGASLKGPKYDLLLRFPNREMNYVLVYGTGNARKAVYDLKYHSDKIPEDIPLVSLGPEKIIRPAEIAKSTAFLKSKWWLWVLMGISVLILGGFSAKMLKEGPAAKED